MTDIYKKIGAKIKDHRGKLKQEELAKILNIPPNTLSRWETGTYKPKAEDLANLSRYFKIPISEFFPGQQDLIDCANRRLEALTSATGGLGDDDFKEVLEYAKFRKARQLLRSNKIKKKS